MLLDYLLKLVFLLGLVFGWDFMTRTLVDKYGIEISHFRLVKREYAVRFDLNYYGLYLHDVVWNFNKRTMLIPNPDLMIKYNKLKDLAVLRKVRARLSLPECVIVFDLKDAFNGNVSVTGSNLLKGNMELNYVLKDNKAIFTKHKGSLKILPLDFTFNKQDKFEMILQESKITVDAKKFGFVFDINPKLLSMELFINSPVLQGEIQLTIGRKNDVRLDLVYIDCMHFLNYLNYLQPSKGTGKGIEFGMLYIHADVAKCAFNMGKALRDIQAEIVIGKNALLDLDLTAQTESKKPLKITTHDDGVIAGSCEDAGSILSLFVPDILQDGLLTGSLDKGDMKWRVDVVNGKLPILNKIQIKHLVSPMRYIRLMMSKPSDYDRISGFGYLSKDLSSLVIENISGSNNYYNLELQGKIEFFKEYINLKGNIVTVSAFSNQNTELFKDSIKFWVDGNLVDPKFGFQLAPWSIIATIFQPILY